MRRNLRIASFALLLFTACSGDEVKPSACREEGEICADGTVCLNGVCIACGDSLECGALACIAGRCRACADDFQCGAGRVCRDGTCHGCESSADCPGALACVNAACVPCGSSTDCGDGRACELGRCVACQVTSQCDNGKVCVESACVACTSGEQCDDGQACLAGACAPCVANDDCGGAGLVCSSGKCGACESRNQCPAGMLCSAGRCAPCGSSSECAAGEACVEGRCGPCSAASECRMGEVCRAGECGPCGVSSECEGGLICRNRACEPCSTTSQCEVGDVCLAGRCGGCAREADCNPGEACVNRKCGPCTSPDECEAGEACAAGACGPCRTSAECRAGEICLEGTRRCGTPGAPDHLELVGGQGQSGLVNTRLAGDLVVRLLDAQGEVVPGASLTFTATVGGGAPGAATVTTDRLGLASTTWRLGQVAGAQQLVVARAGTPLPDAARTGRATFTFVATARPDVADHLEIAAGADQSAPAGTRAPIDPKVKVVDRYGNAIVGSSVTFTLATTGGSVNPARATTDADGFASTAVTLAPAPNANRLVVAGSPALPDVDRTGKATATFVLTGVPGPADHLEKVAGDNQSGQLSTTLPVNPKVKVVDRFGNAVAGVSLDFAASAGIALGHATVLSDPLGLASTTFTFGTTAGAKTLTVSRAGSPLPDAASTGRASVTFTMTATPGDPDHLELVAGEGQSAIAGTKVATNPSVRVVDRWGNSLSNVPVAFNVTAGGGSVTPASIQSNAGGQASTAWTLGLKTGTHRLVAGRQGTALPDQAGSGRATITFTATAPEPAATKVEPAWLPVSGGTLTIDGANLSSDASVTVGGTSTTVTSRSATRLVVTVGSAVARGEQNVVVTSATATTAPLKVLMVLKFTPKIDGAISTNPADADWPVQALLATSTTASDWSGNELRELYLGYDDAAVYIGIKGQAEKQNAIVGYLWHDALALTRPAASGDLTKLEDGAGDGQGDGRGYGCIAQSGTCQATNPPLSLDDMLSSRFVVAEPSFKAYYGFGRTGNAIDLPGAPGLVRHNAVGARDFSPANNFGWADAIVQSTASSQEFRIPRNTFARDTVNDVTQEIRKISTFVRIVGGGGQFFPNQGLPENPEAERSSLTVRSVATIDVR